MTVSRTRYSEPGRRVVRVRKTGPRVLVVQRHQPGGGAGLYGAGAAGVYGLGAGGQVSALPSPVLHPSVLQSAYNPRQALQPGLASPYQPQAAFQPGLSYQPQATLQPGLASPYQPQGGLQPGLSFQPRGSLQPGLASRYQPLPPARQSALPLPKCSYINTDFPGDDLLLEDDLEPGLNAGSARACKARCRLEDTCSFWTYREGDNRDTRARDCFLKTGTPGGCQT